MIVPAIYDRLSQPFSAWITGMNVETLDPWIEIKAEGLPKIGRYLRDERDLAFNYLHCITAVDYFQPDAKRPRRPGGSRTWN